MKILIGLGNPGPRYERTRHNVGFMAIDQAANKWDIAVTKSKFQSLYGEGTWRGEKVVLVKPMTFMNLSGQAVRQVLDWYKPDDGEWAVLYDDMDIPTGSLRLRVKGSAGGHNGIKSIIAHVGTQEFSRIRIGVSRPPVGVPVVDYVLDSFSNSERADIESALQRSVEAMDVFVEEGFTTAMNRFNR